MNPDKLFDYLDGKLAPAERAQVEEQLMSDAQLRRQFEVAREIHRQGGSRREVVVPNPDTTARGSRLGRQIATAAFALVFLNVVGGLSVIAWKNRKPARSVPPDAALRQQIEASLGAAGRNALPAPSLSDDEINLASPKPQWDDLATSVVNLAEASGGSAIKDASDSGVIVTAIIPRERAVEFRQRILGPGSTAPMSPAVNSSGEKTTVTVRIAETAP